jgi:hypothetical protein
MNAPESRTVYLDLNHWYALGAAKAGHPQQSDHVDVLQVLMASVAEGTLAFPLSSVHYMELAENPRDHHREEAANVMVALSKFNTITTARKIVDEELAQSLNKRFGRPAFPIKVRKFGKGVAFALEGEEKRFRLTGGTSDDRAELEAQLGTSIAQWEAEINWVAQYELLRRPLDSYRDQIPNYDPYAARRLADKELASFNVMINTLRTNPEIAARPLDAICARAFFFDFLDNYTRALLSAGFTRNTRQPFNNKEQFTEFLMSLPTRRVTAMIQFHYLKDVYRNWTINDLRDIAALAKVIPYCDIVVTDNKAWDVTVNRAHLDQEFNTAIFRRLTDLAAYLDAR